MSGFKHIEIDGHVPFKLVGRQMSADSRMLTPIIGELHVMTRLLDENITREDFAKLICNTNDVTLIVFHYLGIQ